MRWDALFDDMEAQVEAEERAEFDQEVADLTRAERAGLRLADRLRAQHGRSITLHRAAVGPARGVVTDVGADWVLLCTGSVAHEGGARAERLVPLSAVSGVVGMSGAASGEDDGLARRLGIGTVLRGLAARRCVVRVWVTGGVVLTGRVDRVGADHIDLCLTADGPQRQDTAETRSVPFVAIVEVTALSAGDGLS